MGFSQAIPSPYSIDPSKQICQFIPNSSKEIKQFMADNLLTRTFYDPIDCESSGFVSRGFVKWWDAYYKQYNRSLDDIIKGATQKTNQIKEAEEATEKERKEKETEKEKVEGATKEKTKKSGVNLKATSISEKTRPSESIQSSSESSSKEVSSKSKESTNSKKSKQTKQVAKKIDESINLVYEPLPTDDQIQNQDHPQSDTSSKGYTPSPSAERIETSHAENVEGTSKPTVTKLSSPFIIKKPLSKVVLLTPNVPIQPGTNRGIPIDPRVQFQERLEEVRAENVEKVKKSVRPLPSIPIIDIEGDDELDDLLKVISETKVGSEHVVSNSKNKSVQQPQGLPQPPPHQSPQTEKEDSSIQQVRNAAMQKTILKSTAEKMIELINQPLETLQKDTYWNNELVVFTSCLVEKQFPDAYREKI
ncbi:hypothetical protein PIB30_012474 [Stylosanthes scabra]|uniref:Uncharacterized protein n=1 Tax=Stylosanthes scabra TaxID=79078 RepID=A0ABU6T7G9_9FABA|nr:hypothetical protein [Stylosanthes scabra]